MPSGRPPGRPRKTPGPRVGKASRIIAEVAGVLPLAGPATPLRASDVIDVDAMGTAHRHQSVLPGNASTTRTPLHSAHGWVPAPLPTNRTTKAMMSSLLQNPVQSATSSRSPPIEYSGVTSTGRSPIPQQPSGGSASNLSSTPPTPARRMVTRSLIKGISPLQQMRLLKANAEQMAAMSNVNLFTSKRRYRTRGAGNTDTTSSAAEGGGANAASSGALTSPYAASSLSPPPEARKRGRKPYKKKLSADAGDPTALLNDQLIGQQNSTSESAVSSVPAVRGVLRCVCRDFLVSTQEPLLECRVCRNWCHGACVGLDHLEIRRLVRDDNFVCPYCTPSPGEAAAEDTENSVTKRRRISFDPIPAIVPAPPSSSSTFQLKTSDVRSIAQAPHSSGGSSGGSRYSFSTLSHPPGPRQAPVKLREVPDAFPPNVEALRQAFRSVQRIATELLPYKIIELPHTSLTSQQVEECMQCCAAAVADATFSASYPAYCLKEVMGGYHSYVQGALMEAPAPHATAANDTKARRICSLLFSNGMDVYGNLKKTLTQLKRGLRQGFASREELQYWNNWLDKRYHMPPSPSFTEDCLAVTDVSDFVHVTLTATHPEHQGHHLATILFTLELLKWSIRGRRRAFLNMAIEKKLVTSNENSTSPKSPSGSVVHSGISPSSSPQHREQQVKDHEADGEGDEEEVEMEEETTASQKNTNSGHCSAAPIQQHVEYAAPEASRRLYRRFGFRDVYPRFHSVTGVEQWTAMEVDMGRVMVNFDIPGAALRAAAELEEWFRQYQQQQQQQLEPQPQSTRKLSMAMKPSSVFSDEPGASDRTTNASQGSTPQTVMTSIPTTMSGRLTGDTGKSFVTPSPTASVPTSTAGVLLSSSTSFLAGISRTLRLSTGKN